MKTRRKLTLLIAAIAALGAFVGFTGTIEWDSSKPDGMPRKLLDTSRINALGWTPQISLRDGLTSTYAWYLENVA